MRKVILFSVIIVFALFTAVLATAQEATSTVAIRGSEVATGVLIVTGQQIAPTPGRRVSFELHCNKGMAFCSTPEPGTYVMVRLPKNHGLYDCANVDLYQKDANPETSEKIGEYCLIEK